MADDDTESALREAAGWLARLNARRTDQQTLDEFFAWRRLPGNAEAYVKIETLWNETQRLGNDREIAAAVHDALSRPRWQKRLLAFEGVVRQRPIILAAVSVSFLIIIAGLSMWSSWGTSYSTAVGEQRLIQLADGSSVRLDTDTKITITISHGFRRADLTAGQALFSVAHDPTRPFVVYAGDAEIKAVGTRFDVVSLKATPLKVALLDGQLALSAHGLEDFPVTLRAGAGAIFSGGNWSSPQAIDSDAAIDWTLGRIRFKNTPLAQAINAMNRYTPHKVILSDPGLADLEVSGTFKTDDVAGFVAAITALHQLRAIDQAGDTTALSR